MNEVPIAFLKGILSYDASTGKLTRGTKSAGFRDCEYDRVRVTYNNVIFRIYVHRVAWCLTYGYWPDMHIDHKDGDGHNNRLSNLRLATATQNGQNKGARRDNKLGIKGVRETPYGKYQARIRAGGKELYLGTFDVPEDARSAFVNAAIVVQGEFAHNSLDAEWSASQ